MAAFLVKAKDTGHKYVMKKVHCDSREEAHAALAEMVLLRVLKSPFVVHCIDFFVEDLDVMIVMEFAAGGDLNGAMDRARRRKTHIGEQTVLRWIAEICLGLDTIHKNKILHRDLKPANIFLTTWGSAKIGDFGISKLVEKQTDTNAAQHTAIGTMGFLAPEVVDGKAYGVKADMYSLGCIIYEVCHLRSAYSDMVQRKFPAPLPSEYSQSLSELQRALVEQDPARRPTLDDMLKSPLLASTLETVRREELVYNELQAQVDEIRMLKLKVEMTAPGARALSIKKAATMGVAERKSALMAMEAEAVAERERKKQNVASGAGASADSLRLQEQMEMVDDDNPAGEGMTPIAPPINVVHSTTPRFTSTAAERLNAAIKRLMIDSPASLLVPLVTSLDSIGRFRQADGEGSRFMVKARWLLALCLFLPPALVTIFTMLGVLLHALSSSWLAAVFVAVGLLCAALFSERVRVSRSRRVQVAFLTLVPSMLLTALNIGIRDLDVVTHIGVVAACVVPAYAAAVLSESDEREKSRKDGDSGADAGAGAGAGGRRVPTPLQRVCLSGVSVALIVVLFGCGSRMVAADGVGTDAEAGDPDVAGGGGVREAFGILSLIIAQSIAAIGVNALMSNPHMAASVHRIGASLSNSPILVNALSGSGSASASSIHYATMCAVLVGAEVTCAGAFLSIISLSVGPLVTALPVSLLASTLMLPLLLAATGRLGTVTYRGGFVLCAFGLWAVVASSLSVGWASVEISLHSLRAN